MGIVFISEKNGVSPLKYLGGVISNFENVSNERRLDLKYPEIKSKMLYSQHENLISLILIMITIFYVNSNVNLT